MSRDCCVAFPHGALGLSAVCESVWYFLIILTIFVFVMLSRLFITALRERAVLLALVCGV